MYYNSGHPVLNSTIISISIVQTNYGYVNRSLYMLIKFNRVGGKVGGVGASADRRMDKFVEGCRP